MIDSRNSRSIKDRVFELDIYIHTHTFIAWRLRRSTCHEASIRFNRKYPFPSVGKSFAWFTYDRANLHRMTKGRFGGAKGLASRNKIALRHRETRVFDHHRRLFTKSSLNSQILLRDDPRSTLNDELPIERHLWARTTKKKKINRCRGGNIEDMRTDEILFISFGSLSASRAIFRAFNYVQIVKFSFRIC